MAVKNEAPLVGILMGSDSDLPVMEEAFKTLDSFSVPYEVHILSAHRCPGATSEYARTARERGIKVLMAAAGMAAHLGGVVAAEAILPVIGIPVDASPLGGLDSLLSIVQMPPGIPVATMAIGKAGARNGAILAVQILALGDSALTQKLVDHKKAMAEEVVVQRNKKLQDYLARRKS